MQYRAVRICAIHCFARDPGHNYLQWVILTILTAIAFKPPIPMCRSDSHTARRYCCLKSWIWTDHLVACSGIAVTRCDCWLVRTSCFWPKAYIYLFWHVPVRRVIEVYSVQYSSEKGSSCAAIARVACLHPMLILCFAGVQMSHQACQRASYAKHGSNFTPSAPAAVRRGLMIFKKKFRRVFYVPGNHARSSEWLYAFAFRFTFLGSWLSYCKVPRLQSRYF